MNSELPTSNCERRTHRPLWPAYASESLSSVGTSFLAVGIFFYTTHYFGWGVKENCCLAAAQGAVYIIGSLAAAGLAKRFGQRNSLIVIYAAMTLCALIGLAERSSPALLVIALIGHTFAASVNWPLVESLAIAGGDAHTMSRRVGAYNLVWSITNSIVFAVSGTIIQRWQGGLFVIPAITHTIASSLMLLNPRIQPLAGVADQPAHLAPEPELLHKRTLALWLSRIALPATYVVIYSLMAMMPSLPVLRNLSPALATLIASTWMIARVLMFILLGATTWWHTRPSLLLLSTAIMLFAFIGITVRPSDFPPLASVANQYALVSMILSQIILGIVLGIIYSGSLYFGMVLSDASTEHAGYHEALIGVGSCAGPGLAALAQSRWPSDPRAGVAAVSTIVALTVLAAAVAAARAVRSKSRQFLLEN